MKVKISQLCLTFCDPKDYNLPGSSVHGILQARILEWVAITFSRGSSQPRHRTQVSHIAGVFFTIRATREAWMVRWQVCHNWFEDYFGLSVVQSTLVVPGGPTLEGVIILPLFIRIRIDPIYLYQNITWCFLLNRNSFLFCQLYLKKAGGRL